jgi:hypothetical protein
MFSKKMNGPGSKYEVDVCIKTGHIVWVNRIPVMAPILAPILGSFLNEHISLKNRTYFPLLDRIQPLSKTRTFLSG